MSDAYAHITKMVEPGTKIFTIPGGIDESLYTHPLPEKKERAVLAYMSYSGSEDIKGISVFEQAAKHVPYECRVIKDMNQALLMDVLRESKVYCQISFTECFGMTVLEAMACGCVPVVSNRGALPEVVGFSGVIVPYGGVMETAYAINRAMKMSGDSARQQAKKFSNDRRLSQLTALIKSIPM
jgi:glycosyltransferase involved in cell wall biosynthesis